MLMCKSTLHRAIELIYMLPQSFALGVCFVIERVGGYRFSILVNFGSINSATASACSVVIKFRYVVDTAATTVALMSLMAAICAHLSYHRSHLAVANQFSLHTRGRSQQLRHFRSLI